MPNAQLLPRAVTEASFVAWLTMARAGERITYYRGVLALDVAASYSRLAHRDRVELGRVARSALDAFERGQVHLLQQRHGPDDFSYLAIARPRDGAPSNLETL